MNQPATWLLILAIAGPSARAQAPATVTEAEAEAAGRAWAIADTVLTRNVAPPTRQQMLMAGLQAVAKAGADELPNRLARLVSDLTSPDQLASLMAETWAGSKLLDREKREATFFEGMLAIVPGEPRLFSTKERKVEESMQANLYVGIQVALGMDETAKRPVFQQILVGGPAEAAGARAGDLIEEIDGVSTESIPLAKVVDRLRGQEGTDVLVQFRHVETGEVFTKPMTRGRLPRVTVQGLSPLPRKRWDVRLDGNSPIGYLKITEISGSTPRELRDFANQLESEGAKALVLDLRETTMARFHPTVLLADSLLEGGIIGRVKSAEGDQDKVYEASPDALFRGWPLVVLVGSTTQQEVVWLADALRDNKRATILGNPVLNGDPYVREMVGLSGGDWSIQLASGILRRGNGKPLAVASTETANSAAYLALKSMDGNLAAQLRQLTQTQAPEDAKGQPGFPADDLVGQQRKAYTFLNPLNPPVNRQRDLGQARQILEAALKSTSN